MIQSPNPIDQPEVCPKCGSKDLIEGGEYSLEVFAEIKNVCISMGSHHIPRWGV